MVNYYHRFMPNIAQKLIPLHKAVGNKKGKSIEWSKECYEAFEDAKRALSKATLLSHPGKDAETTLTVDASDVAMGGVLEQKIRGRFRPVAFFSKKLKPAERKYSAFDRELLGIYSAIKHFQNFVEGRCFTIFTDHKPLTTVLASQAERSPRQTRHLSFISEFTSDIRHVRGTDNEVADALSRIEAVSRRVEVEELAKSQAESPEVTSYIGNPTSGLEVKKVKCGNHELVCDVSTGKRRPIVPLDMRRKVFDIFHGLAHAGPRPTQKAILREFVWKNLKRDVIDWCRSCHECQASKISTHIHTPWSKREPPDRRFGSLHVDLVGPLPVSEGHKYLFTVVDRFSRWPEAIPLEDMTAQSCAKALLRHWVARFGVPDDITSDRGRQFTSDLWKELNEVMGTKHNQTTAYHPMANGLVERLHRQLKSSIMARSSGTDWMDHLPLVMLGIRSAWRTELDCSPAELVYGMALKVPGFMLGDNSGRQELPSSEFVQDLFTRMRTLEPVEMAHHATAKVNIPAAIDEAEYVYIRTDAVRAPLVRPYTGPFKVLQKSAKYFTVLKNGKSDTVSIDRLKPAAVYDESTQKTTERSSEEKSRRKNIEITQPRVSYKNPETVEVSGETQEVATKTYRDALLCDPEGSTSDEARAKRKYEKRPPEHRTEVAATRSGRLSRPPVRL